MNESYSSLRNKNIHIDQLDIGTHGKNALKNFGIYTFKDLLDYKSKGSLNMIPNLGEKSIKLINIAINEINISQSDNEATEDLPELPNSTDTNNYSKKEIDILNLSTRSSNGLKAYGIYFIQDLINLKTDDLIAIPNLGEKCIVEIAEALESVDLILKKNEPIKFQQFDNISEAIDWLFDNKFKKRKDVLKFRLFDGYSLEKCGQHEGVTRERIRQIEAKFISTLNNKLSNKYISELNEYFNNHAGIDGFIELNNIGPAFKSISKYLLTAKNPRNFIRAFFVKPKLLKWQKKNNSYYLFPYNSKSLDELINDDQLINFINNSPFPKLSDSVKAYCIINNQENNLEYIFEEIQSKLSKRANFACLYAITQLKKNYTYITTEQVIEFLKENCNKDFSSQIRHLNNILSSSDSTNPVFDVRDINLYMAKGQGNFFFLDKLEIENIDQEEIVNFVLEVIKRKPDKNFNSKEFLDYFIETERLSKNTIEILDRYIIDAILLSVASEHDVLNYLGRSTWSGNENALRKKRTKIYPTVLKILEDNGAPMLLKEIKKEISKVRGHGTNFQLHTTLSSPKLIQISSGLWGLRDRDINVSKDQELEMVNQIQKNFIRGNKILDFHDIKCFKESIGIDEDVSICQLMRLIQAHIPVGRRRTPGSLIFLLKSSSKNPLNFCIYSPEISDKEASEYIKSKIDDDFFDVRDNEDSIRGPIYIIENKKYFGRQSIMKDYDLEYQTIGYRINSDKYPNWKKYKSFQ